MRWNERDLQIKRRRGQVSEFNINQRSEELHRKLDKVSAILKFNDISYRVEDVMKNNPNLDGKKVEDVIVNSINSLKTATIEYRKKCMILQTEEEKDIAYDEFLIELNQNPVIKSILNPRVYKEIADGNFKNINNLERWAKYYQEACTNGTYSPAQLRDYEKILKKKVEAYDIYQTPKSHIKIEGIPFVFGNKKYIETNGKFDEREAVFDRSIIEQQAIEKELVNSRISMEKCKMYAREMLKNKRATRELRKKFERRNGKKPKCNKAMKMIYCVINFFTNQMAPDEIWDEELVEYTAMAFKRAVKQNARMREEARETIMFDRELYNERYLDKMNEKLFEDREI